MARNEAQAATNQVLHHLASARSLAIHTGRIVTFCGLNAADQCTRENIKTFAVFIDSNNNRAVDDGDTVQARFQVRYSGRMALRASNTRYINFRPGGYANPYGSVFFCPQSNSKELIRRVSVSAPGRAYVAVAKRPGGFVVNVNGSDIDCT